MADTIIQQFPVGFGSYLAGILPPDVATAAGAFGVSVGQIKNITTVPVEKFAQVCMNLETIKGLNVNGTQVPTNLNLRNAARPLIALGSGPQQSYTMSDFFGCMSGLPYNGPLINIYNKLNEVATRKLFNIYHETYLAVTYARARLNITQPVYFVNIQPFIENPANPNYQPNPSEPNYDPDPYVNYSTGVPTTSPYFQPRIDDWYYTLQISVDVKGGGYSRGTAPPPNISFDPNNVMATAVSTINNNDSNIPGDFGRVTSASIVSQTPFMYETTTVNQYGPPDPPEPDEEWVYIELPPIDYLPVQANGNFATNGTNVPPGYGKSTLGDTDPGPAQWPGMNLIIQQYIDQANDEIDAILLAKPTQCKSLNDSWNDTGYQLNIEQRARVSALRPPLDDVTREDFLSLFPTSQYTFTDSIPLYAKNIMPHMYAQTLEAICNLNTPGGQSIVAMMRESRNQNRLTEMGVTLDNNIKDTLTNLQQSILAGTPVVVGGQTVPTGTIPIATYDPTTNDSIIVNPDYSTNNPADVGTTGSNTTSTTGSTSSTIEVVDYGTSTTPGSFSGSEYANITPPNLNIYNISNTLLSSTYTIAEAIDDVIRCNCDCWDLI